MAKKPTAKEAQLILKLYDLRRETEMRKARSWWMKDFWPKSADDFMKVAWALGTQENNWMRQVAGYWGIATSFVLQDVLSDDLFLVPGFSGEMFLMFGKIYPFLSEIREKLDDPEFFLDMEKTVKRTKWGRDRLQFLLKRLETWQARLANEAQEKK